MEKLNMKDNGEQDALKEREYNIYQMEINTMENLKKICLVGEEYIQRVKIKQKYMEFGKKISLLL